MIRRPSAQRLGEARRRRALHSGLDGSGGPRRRLVTDMAVYMAVHMTVHMTVQQGLSEAEELPVDGIRVV